MMEEWHQKLHNNTSPDDVVICEALLAYIDAGLDISAYWATLKVQSRFGQAVLCPRCRQQAAKQLLCTRTARQSAASPSQANAAQPAAVA